MIRLNKVGADDDLISFSYISVDMIQSIITSGGENLVNLNVLFVAC